MKRPRASTSPLLDEEPDSPSDGPPDGRHGSGTEAGAAADRLDLGPLPGLIGYALRRTQVAVFADFIATLAALELRPAQFSVLLLIRLNPGRKQSDIAEALGIQRPNFVAMMEALDGRGLTRRSPSAVDRRSYALELTEAGHRLLDEALALVARHEARVRADLDAAETEALVALLARINRALG
jgi:DNA-binding MarR family transcriptional regulator